jgi:hypothetical protein
MNLIRRALLPSALALACGAAALAAQERPQPPRMPHPAAGHEQCLTCHGPAANEHIKSTPANHHYAATACAMCHRAAERMPPAVSHPLDDAHATCATCHVAGGAAASHLPPASHATYHASICKDCHVAQAQPGSEE